MKKAVDVRGTLRLMKPGDSFWVKDTELPYGAVRNAANIVGKEMGCKFSTDRDKWRGRTLITRIS